ncbi:MAG: hypothetical protein U9Q17_02580 [Chloroflexota bacterium]|nr:hypothetical protein [Chloroflexota bacterium]
MDDEKTLQSKVALWQSNSALSMTMSAVLPVYSGNFGKKVSIFWSKALFAGTGDWSGCGVCC